MYNRCGPKDQGVSPYRTSGHSCTESSLTGSGMPVNAVVNSRFSRLVSCFGTRCALTANNVQTCTAILKMPSTVATRFPREEASI